MKTLNEKTYVTSPIAMMATIISAANQNEFTDCQNEADKMVTYYNSLGNYSNLVICDVSYTELITEQELEAMLNIVLVKVGNVQSFSARIINAETSSYNLKCALGIFNMIFVKDDLNNLNNITAIEFYKEELHAMSCAA